MFGKHLENIVQKYNDDLHATCERYADYAATKFLKRNPKRKLRLISGMGRVFWVIDDEILEHGPECNSAGTIIGTKYLGFWKNRDVTDFPSIRELIKILEIADEEIPQHGACYMPDKTYA